MSNGLKAVLVLLVGVFVGLVVVIVLFAGSVRQPKAATPAGVEPTAASTDAAAASGSALERVRSSGVLKVLMDTGTPAWVGSPPMYQLDAEGKPSGFDYALARRIAAAVGVPEVKVVHALYSDLLANLTEGKEGDLVIAGFIPVEQAGVAWSEPYLELGLCLIVHDGKGVHTIDDLYGKAVGVYDDDAAKDAVRKMVKGFTELVVLENGYLDQLLSDRFAGFIYDQPFAVAEIKEFYEKNPHRRGELRIAQYNLTDEVYAVGVRAGDADLLAAVNQAIAAWRADPAYKEALRTWIKSDDPALEPVVTADVKQVKVAAGDTLSLIAERELGDRGRWKDLWALNKARFASPDLIEVGDSIVLP